MRGGRGLRPRLGAILSIGRQASMASVHGAVSDSVDDSHGRHSNGGVLVRLAFRIRFSILSIGLGPWPSISPSISPSTSLERGLTVHDIDPALSSGMFG